MKPVLTRRARAGVRILGAVVALVAIAAHGDPRDTKRGYARAELVDQVALRIDLGPAAPPPRTRARSLRIGFHRAVPETVGALAGRLAWAPLADGGFVASVVVRAPGATSVRVALAGSLGRAGELRYFKPGAPPLGHAVVTQADLANAPAGGRVVPTWSPSVAGEALGMEFAVPATAARADFDLRVVTVAHGTADPSAVVFRPKALVCADHVDVRCRADVLPAGLINAVARMRFEADGGTYACTGTLLRDAPGTGAAFFLTANHCVPTAAVAATVETTWFYERPLCGLSTADPGVTVTDGAALLATSVAQDSTLLRLGPLPPGVAFADWTRTAPALRAPVIGIHHPGGKAKRFAGGDIYGVRDAVLGPRQIIRDALLVRWVDGLTEPGSSGSGLFHGGALIGVLAGGSGTCDVREDGYGPFAAFYPRACPWLAPGEVCVDDATVPLFLAAGDDRRESFVRLINHSAKAGRVWVHATDSDGRSAPPIPLTIAANAVAHFNSGDLENGNAAKGIHQGVGAGEGHWRLRIAADVDIEALAYMRTREGFVASLHDVVRERWPGNYQVPFFNPASNEAQVSVLRLVNPHAQEVRVDIRGTDDRGRAGGPVALTLAPGRARSVTAQELEAGEAALEGALGDGAGKWRLEVTASRGIDVLSLLETPGGKLANLSTFATPTSAYLEDRAHRAPLFAAARDAAQQGFVRLSNYGYVPATVYASAVDDAGRRHALTPLKLAPGESRHFNSDDLEDGRPAKGVPVGVGAGDGYWRLEFERVPPSIEPLAYTRSVDGFVASMHEVVPGPQLRHEVPFFNPASNAHQRSMLRLVNPTEHTAQVTIAGVDDRGERGSGVVALTLPAQQSRIVTAQQLEAGDADIVGNLGDGHGKWRLTVTADRPIDVVNVLESPTGDLANLSTATRRR